MGRHSDNPIADYAESMVGHPCVTGLGSVEGGFGAFSFVRHVVEASTRRAFPSSIAMAVDLLPHVDLVETMPGDLVFFNTEMRPFSHVGILLSGGAFAHVLGKCGTVEYGSIRLFRWRSILSGARRFPCPPAERHADVMV